MVENKKRKAEGSSHVVTDLKVKSVDTGYPAVLGSFFSGFTVPESADIELYKKRNTSDFIIHGEATRPVIQIDGSSKDGDDEYCLGVYDPAQKSVKLYKVPFIKGAVTTKLHQKFIRDIQSDKLSHAQRRNILGEEFGTKKAKKAISDLDRNRVDASKLEDLQDDIVENVKLSTNELPTQQEMKDSLDAERPIPPYQLDINDLQEVYPISGIIPNREMALIKVDHIVSEKNPEKRMEMLPLKKSTYLLSRIADASKSKLKLLYYLSLLLAFYQNRRSSSKNALVKKVENVPDGLIDGILDRFTIAKASEFGRRKNTGFSVDPYHETKLLCYILVLMLHIDNFKAELSPLSQELSVAPSKLKELFKALGCSVSSATMKDAEKFNIPRGAAHGYLIATLKAPLKLPEVSRRKRR